MNVHYCPRCKRGFFCAGSPGDLEKLPKHYVPGWASNVQCEGARQPAEVVRPPQLGSEARG